MVLDFLPVESEAEVSKLLLVNAGKLLGRGGAQRDALVGGAKQDVKVEIWVRGAVLGDCTGVSFADAADQLALAEETAVEEIRALAAGFEGEVSKGQDAGA